MPAHFVAIGHNLLLLRQDWHEQQGVENTAEIQRRQERLDQQASELEKTGQSLPLIYKTLQRFALATFKLIRWLRVHCQPTSLRKPCSSYAPSLAKFKQANPTPMFFFDGNGE